LVHGQEFLWFLQSSVGRYAGGKPVAA
jgi:hypothetical protein